MADYPAHGHPNWDDELKAYIDAAIVERSIALPDDATDGQGLVYSDTLGLWVPANETGESLNAGTQNVTGTITTASAGPAVGLGTVVDIPSTGISVLNSGGRQVKIEFEASIQQSVAGTGTVWLVLYETTSGLVGRRYNLKLLPGVTTANLNQIGLGMSSVNIGVVTTTRTFKLSIAVAAATGSPSVQVFNQATNPTIIRAINL